MPGTGRPLVMIRPLRKALQQKLRARTMGTKGRQRDLVQPILFPAKNF